MPNGVVNVEAPGAGFVANGVVEKADAPVEGFVANGVEAPAAGVELNNEAVELEDAPKIDV